MEQTNHIKITDIIDMGSHHEIWLFVNLTEDEKQLNREKEDYPKKIN